MRAPRREFGADPSRPAFVPNKAVVKLRYSEVSIGCRVPTAARTNMNYVKISMNGLSDPYDPIGGHYHRGLDKYWKLYQTYTVTKAKLRWWVDLAGIESDGGGNFLPTAATGTVNGQTFGGDTGNCPVALFSQMARDTSQVDVATPSADTGGVYNWPSVQGTNTKVTTCNSKYIEMNSVEGPPLYFDLKKWKKTYPQDAGTTNTYHSPYSGYFSNQDGLGDPDTHDPQYECFAWIGIAGLTDLGLITGPYWKFRLRFELETTIVFEVPKAIAYLNSVPSHAEALDPTYPAPGDVLNGTVVRHTNVTGLDDAALDVQHQHRNN